MVKKILLTITFLAIAAQPTFATTYNFVGNCGADCGNITGPFGNVRSFIGDDGSTVKVTGYNTTTSDDLSAYVAAYLGHYDKGLGVSSNPGDENHSIDNLNLNDLVLFEFDSVVDPASLFLYTFGDTDIDVLVGTAAPNLSLVGQNFGSLAGLGFTYLGTFLGDASDDRTALLNGTLSGNYLLVLAAMGQSDDSFKIGTASTAAAVPEPMTMGLLGLGCLGLAARRRRLSLQ